ncbi:DUF3558 domain-containing protein [Allokutzneria sp. NRRL B-24872]|uniref:DUF3558 domain-containing protein n=1 Tax=Allokutzneria sp. NRRL B-24872 TaxID=1137961 RepID=UPI000A3D16FB|nr:DUF3558 domain-containing protein [Allokutzneria sp. NRRL B-24872]
MRALGVLIAVLLVAGCSAAPGEGAKPKRTRVDEPLPTTAPISLPPRPREVKLDRADPCKLLTAAQRKDLGMDRPPQSGTNPNMGDAKVCDFRDSTRALSVRIGLVVIQGVEVWLDETAQADVTQTQIGEFPAVVVRTAAQTGFCNVDVDVAAGQFLDVQFGNAGSAHPPSLEQMCSRAQEVAQAAMRTLISAK